MPIASTAIKVGERTVTWEFAFNHSAQVYVYQSGGFPNNLFCDVRSNGTLAGHTQLGEFYIGNLIKTVQGPLPGATQYPLYFEMIVPGSYTPINCNLTYGVGTHSNELVGTLTITAVCDIMYDTVDDGVHGWAIDGDSLIETGPLLDTPNLNHTKVYLRLQSDASYSMVTNTNTYTGTIGLTEGIELQNRLWATAVVTSTSTSYEANGSVTVTNSNGAYAVDSNVSRSWTDSASTATADVSAGHVASTALSSDLFEMVSSMAATWNVERTADLDVALFDQSGTGLNADIAIERYGDDTKPVTKATVSGRYAEAISQMAFTWDWTATHNGNSAPAPLTGGYTNWGNIGVALDADLAAAEQQKLPDDWAASSSSPYLVHRDTTIPIHTFNNGDVVSISQAASYFLRAGYNGGNYTASSNTLTASGDVSTGSQVGAWTVSAGATVELDNTNERILVKPASGVYTVAKRTLLLDPAQCGGYSATKPPRDAWTGYRWISIVLEPADPSTGIEITSVGDSIIVEVDQDNLSAMWPIPSEQTWTGTANVTKRYTALTQRTGNTTYISVDLANPVSPAQSAIGGNPNVTGNYGDDTTAQPNVLSHYPHPTLDAPCGGVTNAKELRITLPGDTWWRIGDITLDHSEGVTPVYELMPAYNQWIRKERKDRIDEDDEAEAKNWGRRLFISRCEGLLGAELFDIERSTAYSVGDGYHVFSFIREDVYTTLEQLTSIDQLQTLDTSADVGAIRKYPGWAYTITMPDSGSYPIKYDIAAKLMAVGCYLGGRGIVWAGDNPTVSSELVLGTTNPTLQAVTHALDWFADCGDIFEVDDHSTTGAINVKAATVLRGKIEGLGKYGNTYDLTEDTRPTVTTSTIASNVAAGVHGDLVVTGGHPKLNHEVLKHGASSGVEYTAPTITWTVLIDSDPSIITTTVTEAPSWWEHRGIYGVQFAQRDGVLRPRFRASDKKPLCQKRGVGRTNEGRCVRCIHGA